jgi:ribonuclease P protein component
LQFVFANPSKIAHKYLIALYRLNTRSYARLGIIIGKQHLKRAIDRNLLRRIIRESFRYQKEALKGLDIIVVLRSECTPLDKKALRDNIDNLWQALLAKLAPISSSKPV